MTRLVFAGMVLGGYLPLAEAKMFTLHLGPPSVGAGGPNPLSIPPTNPAEYEFEYISDSGFETSVAITPGIFFGKRTGIGNSSHYYVGAGGGLVIDTNGAGPGPYFDMGFNFGKTIMFNGEIKQAIGYHSRSVLISPYAIRLGASLAF